MQHVWLLLAGSRESCSLPPLLSPHLLSLVFWAEEEHSSVLLDVGHVHWSPRVYCPETHLCTKDTLGMDQTLSTASVSVYTAMLLTG